SFPPRVLVLIARRSHPVASGFWDLDPGDLVVEELGVPARHEREYPGDHGNREGLAGDLLVSLPEREQRVDRIERLREDEARTRLGLPCQETGLPFQVGCARGDRGP